MLNDVTIYITRLCVQLTAVNYSPHGVNIIGWMVDVTAIKYMYSTTNSNNPAMRPTLLKCICDVINTVGPVVLWTV